MLELMYKFTAGDVCERMDASIANKGADIIYKFVLTKEEMDFVKKKTGNSDVYKGIGIIGDGLLK